MSNRDTRYGDLTGSGTDPFATAAGADRAAGRGELDDAITTALASITAVDAKGWLVHCGYSIPGQLI